MASTFLWVECKSTGTCLVGDVERAREAILKGLTIHLTSLHTQHSPYSPGLPIFWDILWVSPVCSGSVQSLSHFRLFATPWTAAHQASLSITNSQSFLRLVHWVGDAIQPSHPLSSPFPPTFNFSQHQGLFPVSQLFTSSGQSIGISASASVLLMTIQDWFPLGWTG